MMLLFALSPMNQYPASTSSGVVWSRSESLGVVRSRSESFGIVWSLPESATDGIGERL